jgi:hypothetical protein
VLADEPPPAAAPAPIPALAEPVPELPEVSSAVLGPCDGELLLDEDEGELVELLPVPVLIAAPAPAVPIAPPGPASVSLGLVDPLLAGALDPVPRGA